MHSFLARFLADDAGGATVDLLVLTAGCAALALAIMTMFSDSAHTLGNAIGDVVASAVVAQSEED